MGGGNGEGALSVGLVNVRSWKGGKLSDVCEEMKRSRTDVLAVTQTTLRGDVSEEYEGYKFLGKGRKNMTKLGGGLVL